MFFKKLKFISETGYSLVELLTVIAVIGIMTAIAASSYSESKRSAALEKAARELVSDLRRAQNMAMNTAVFDNGGTLVVPAGGYGIHLAPSSATYTLFADTFTTLIFPDKIYTPGLGFDGKVLEHTFDFPIIVDSTGASDIDFLPPNPTGYFDGNNFPDTATITLKYDDTTAMTKTITINRITGQSLAD